MRAAGEGESGRHGDAAMRRHGDKLTGETKRCRKRRYWLGRSRSRITSNG